MVTEKVARKVSRDSSLVPGPSPPNLDQSFQTLPKQPVGTGLWKAERGQFYSARGLNGDNRPLVGHCVSTPQRLLSHLQIHT